MSWTYDVTLLASTPLYQVRFWVGDTDITRQLVQDEEILFVLTEQPNPKAAAADIADAIAGKLSQEADARVGDLSESSSQKAEAFRKLAQDLRRTLSASALPVFGGIRHSQKEVLEEDPDLVQPSFRKGQDDHPELPSEQRQSDWWRWN